MADENTMTDERTQQIISEIIADDEAARAHGPFIAIAEPTDFIGHAYEPGSKVRIGYDLAPAYMPLGSDQIMRVMAAIDTEIADREERIKALRAWRDEMGAEVVKRAEIGGQAFEAHGYEVRLNKGKAVTKYDAGVIVPLLTDEQRAIACSVKYEIVEPVFAAMLKAKLLPDEIGAGVIVTPARERWEIRKAKGGK